MDYGNSTPASRAWGIAGTVLFHAIVLGLMLLMVMDYNVRRHEMLDELALNQVEEQEDSVDVLMPGEYVMVGDDFYQDVTTPEETAPPTAADNAATASDNMLTTTAKADIKATPRRDTESADQRRARAAEKQAEERRNAQAAKIGERVQFGKPGEGEGADRRPGSVDGNKSTGAALAGRPGVNLKGRTLSHWDNPSATESGTIVIAVRVDRKGHVVSASYARGTGSVASNLAARRSCVARRCAHHSQLPRMPRQNRPALSLIASFRPPGDPFGQLERYIFVTSKRTDYGINTSSQDMPSPPEGDQ